MKTLVIVVVLVFLIPAIFLIVLVGGVDSAGACSTGQTPIVKGVPQLDEASLRNAETVVAVGRRLNVPTRGWVVALATARQESTIHNLANSNVPESLLLPNEGVGHDHDSVGIMQQRPSWGTVTERMDVAIAARLFYERLVRVANWQMIPVTDAAQAVQGSATPNAYAKWELLATQLVEQVTGGAVNCAAGVTTDITGKAGVVITKAESNLDTLYQFGGDCSDSHSSDMSKHCDCSSLVMTAWAAAGVSLPRTSDDQYLATARVSGVSPTNVVALQPGDLLFYNPGEDGRPGLPGHVALYIGNGKLIEAPQPGQTVSIRPIYSSGWLGAGRVT